VRVCVFADAHFGYPNKEISERVLEGFKCLLNEECDLYISVGDFFNSSTPVFSGFLSAFRAVVESGKKFIFLAGNHDFRRPSALECFEPVGARVIFKETVVELDGKRCVFCPFPQKGPKIEGDILFCHGPYSAFGEYKFVKDVLDFEASAFELVFLGDLHQNRKLGNVLVPGSLACLSIKDVPGYYVLEIPSLRVETKLLPKVVSEEKLQNNTESQNRVIPLMRTDLRDFLKFWREYCEKLGLDYETFHSGVEFCS